MKKLVIGLLLGCAWSGWCNCVWAGSYYIPDNIVSENKKSGRVHVQTIVIRPEPKKTYISKFLVGTGALAGAIVLTFESKKEHEDAMYAHHVLEESYEYNNMGAVDLMGYQNHYLGEYEKHRYREGMYDGVRYVLFTISAISYGLGICDYLEYKKDYENYTQRVGIKPLSDGAMAFAQIKWGGK